MGIVESVLGLLAFSAIAVAISFAFGSQEVKRAAIFAIPQRKTIGLSKFVSRHSSARRLYNAIWPSRYRMFDKGRIDLETFDPKQLDHSPIVAGNPLTWFLKRLMDIILSVTLLVFMAPLMIVVAVLVRLDSQGPSLYRQERVGLRRRPITVTKFRTMRIDAEKSGAQWAEEDDPRITRIGKFLRKTRLDELPQLWPILLGQMSFVGPRPERPEFQGDLEDEIKHFEHRLAVKPGLTGWAQVSAPYSASVDDARRKLAYDLYYIQHHSALLDWFIVVKTLRVALLGVGSR